MTGADESQYDTEEVIRAAARTGLLAKYLPSAPPDERGMFFRRVSELVYGRVTRPYERKRGHRRCAGSIDQLEPDCHDRHQDNVVAVYEYVLRYATGPIANLEAWLASRLTAASVDAHRRRRGERGALQRPRRPLPKWLSNELAHDSWLEALAVEILTWVGVPTTAGLGTWPLSAWADRRSTLTGEPGSSETQIASDIERVLAAMRARPKWYDQFVEQPLGQKLPPLLPRQRDDREPVADQTHLSLVQQHEVYDSYLLTLAAEAVDAITTRIRLGEEPLSVVISVLEIVFGSGTGVEHIDRPPGDAPAEDERLVVLLADWASRDRIVAAVLDILDEG